MTKSQQDVESVRLQKVLASVGVGSRRRCEELIAAGRVQVNGVVVSTLGTKVDPARVVLHVDGVRLAVAEGLVCLALNKPLGVLSAMSDARGRRCVGDLVADRAERLFHVGRLDVSTEGLLLLTNDGKLAHRLAHPSFGVAKTYLAEVDGPVPRDLGRRLRAGVLLDARPVAVEGFRVVGRSGRRAMVELTVHEGRKHIVRRLLAEVGHPVSRLVRLQFGPVALGALRPGQLRELNPGELGALYAEVGL
jgi:23S rRNA pseudouridine2605 synthase